MQLRVWQSFSCNNSGSYYLVARFKDAETAAKSADELTEFLEAHAKQVDAMWEADGDPTETWTDAAVALGKKHGFEWDDMLMWGDDMAEGDEPAVATAGKTLVIHHSYCGGFGEALPKYFAAVGATTDEEIDGAPSVSVLFARPVGDVGEKMSAELAAFFGQDFPEDDDYPEEWETEAPWGSEWANMVYDDSKALSYFDDGETIGFQMIFNMAGMDELKKYLAKTDDFEIALERNDRDRFRAIAAAKCKECDSADMRFIDASRKAAPTDQLACRACGGMFPLSEFQAPASE